MTIWPEYKRAFTHENSEDPVYPTPTSATNSDVTAGDRTLNDKLAKYLLIPRKLCTKTGPAKGAKLKKARAFPLVLASQLRKMSVDVVSEGIYHTHFSDKSPRVCQWAGRECFVETTVEEDGCQRTLLQMPHPRIEISIWKRC